MILSRKEVKNLLTTKALKINPLAEDQLQPVGIDLTLEEKALDPDLKQEISILDTPLKPGQFVLINSVEYISLPNYLVGKLVSRTSVARLGLLVGLNADLVEPNFSGKVTFAIKNISNQEIWLKPNLRVAQLTFEEVSSPESEAKPLRYNYKNPEASNLCEEMV